MAQLNSALIANRHAEPKLVRLDAIDRRLLSDLVKDARTPNNLLASRAGVAPSTSLTRIRRLEEEGVIKGYHADLDLGLLGMSVHALLQLRVQVHARPRMLAVARQLRAEPNVLGVFLIAGDRDLVVHVVCESTDDLKNFINDKIGTNLDIASSNTNLVFEEL
ncbi:MAG: Lrp/AsnC family transcriptional regulator [Propionibacteriaceae bacterium]|nr:Lrp/AsnC family transcriptional regulator [Propionibacteriaceae bacterium]